MGGGGRKGGRGPVGRWARVVGSPFRMFLLTPCLRPAYAPLTPKFPSPRPSKASPRLPDSLPAAPDSPETTKKRPRNHLGRRSPQKVRAHKFSGHSGVFHRFFDILSPIVCLRSLIPGHPKEEGFSDYFARPGCQKPPTKSDQCLSILLGTPVEHKKQPKDALRQAERP